MSKWLAIPGAAISRHGIGILILLGIALGALNSACNHGLSQYGAKIIGNDWGWLIPGLASAYTGKTWNQSFRHSAILLNSAVLAYYISDAVAGVYTTMPIDDPMGSARFSPVGMIMDIIPYLIIGTMTAVILGGIVSLMHRGGVIGLFASVLLPGYLTWDAWDKRRDLTITPGFIPDPVLLRVSELFLPLFALTTLGVLLIGAARLGWSPTRDRISNLSKGLGN